MRRSRRHCGAGVALAAVMVERSRTRAASVAGTTFTPTQLLRPGAGDSLDRLGRSTISAAQRSSLTGIRIVAATGRIDESIAAGPGCFVRINRDYQRGWSILYTCVITTSSARVHVVAVRAHQPFGFCASLFSHPCRRNQPGHKRSMSQPDRVEVWRERSRSVPRRSSLQATVSYRNGSWCEVTASRRGGHLTPGLDGSV